MCIQMCPPHTTAHTWRSENSLREWFLSFHHLSSGDQTQVVRFGSKHIYLLSPLTSPSFCPLWGLGRNSA